MKELKIKLEQGKTYISEEKIWAIDYTNLDYLQVYLEDRVLKVKREQLVIWEKRETHE